MTRAKIDWAAACAWWVAQGPTRTYAAVAAKFGVSEAAVRKHANNPAKGWQEAARDADASAADAVRRQAIKTREQRALQDARIRDLAANRVESRLLDDDAEIADDWVARVLQDADKRVRLNEGEATDHVAVAQVQAGFRESLGAAVQLVLELAVDRGLAGDELLRVFREALPGRVQERLALLGGDE